MNRTLRSLLALFAAAAVSLGSAGGTLIGAFDVGPGGLAVPAGPWYNTAGNTWISKIWTPLLSLDATASDLVPQLATSWSSNDDYTEWTFDLRQMVSWHDGEAFTADDVVFTWHFAYAPDSAAAPAVQPAMLVGQEAYKSGAADSIAGIEAMGDYTVKFTTVEPAPRFPNTLLMAYILPEHAMGDVSPADIQTTDWWFTTAIGTGPFMHDEFVADESWALVPNPAYWNGAPKLDRLINRYFADETSAILALEAGDIHFTYVSGDVAVGLGDQARFDLFQGPSGVTNYMMFNYRNPLFEDVRIRQAMLYAIDRQTIAEVVLNGTAQVVPCISPFSSYWPDSYNDYAYDPDMARSLLADAGWNSSNTVEIKTYYGSQFHADAMAAMQQFLSEVGVNVEFIVDSQGYNSYFYDGVNWDISYRGLGVNMNAFPYQFYEQGGYPNSEGDTGTLNGKIFPELESLFAQARPEGDPDTYRQIMKDICAFQNANAVEAYMWTAVRFGVAASDLVDFYWYPAPAGGPYEDSAEMWSLD